MEDNNFMDKLIADLEEKERIQSEAWADFIALQIRELTEKMAKIAAQVEEEIQLINNWAEQKCDKINRNISFLSYKLEEYLKNTGLKTIDLPNARLQFRKRPDKVEISDLELFLQNAREELLNYFPEEYKPDLNKIKAWIKEKKSIPPGVRFVIGEEGFSLKLKDKGVENGSSEI